MPVGQRPSDDGKSVLALSPHNETDGNRDDDRHKRQACGSTCVSTHTNTRMRAHNEGQSESRQYFGRGVGRGGRLATRDESRAAMMEPSVRRPPAADGWCEAVRRRRVAGARAQLRREGRVGDGCGRVRLSRFVAEYSSIRRDAIFVTRRSCMASDELRRADAQHCSLGELATHRATRARAPSTATASAPIEPRRHPTERPNAQPPHADSHRSGAQPRLPASQLIRRCSGLRLSEAASLPTLR